MVMLCAAGLLEKADGRHRNAADVERYLVEGKPGYMGPWITFTKPQWTQWGRLAEHLRTKDLKVMGSIETFTVADARRYHDGDLLDRPGRGPPLRPPGRPFGPQAHHGYRRRLGRLLHRRRQGTSGDPRRGARPAGRVRGGARLHRRQRRRRPRRGAAPATSRAIRSRPIATSPSWPPTCRCTAAR